MISPNAAPASATKTDPPQSNEACEYPLPHIVTDILMPLHKVLDSDLDTLVDIEEVAKMTKMSERSIWRELKKNDGSFPMSADRPGSKRRVWIKRDIVEFVRNLRPRQKAG